MSGGGVRDRAERAGLKEQAQEQAQQVATEASAVESGDKHKKRARKPRAGANASDAPAEMSDPPLATPGQTLARELPRKRSGMASGLDSPVQMSETRVARTRRGAAGGKQAADACRAPRGSESSSDASDAGDGWCGGDGRMISSSASEPRSSTTGGRGRVFGTRLVSAAKEQEDKVDEEVDEECEASARGGGSGKRALSSSAGEVLPRKAARASPNSAQKCKRKEECSNAKVLSGTRVAKQAAKFVLVCGRTAEREEQAAAVRYLGGQSAYLHGFHENATHVLVKELRRTEKFLCACAGGRWILKPAYIEACKINNQWLQEQSYEWNNTRKMDKDQKDLWHGAPRRWRQYWVSLSASQTLSSAPHLRRGTWTASSQQPVGEMLLLPQGSARAPQRARQRERATESARGPALCVPRAPP